MPKLDLDAIPQTNATGYPGDLAAAVAGRWVRRVGKAVGLTDFGASHVVLKPGASSSQRHWHEDEDELVVMLVGEAVLIEEDGRVKMRAGDMAAFPKGDPNGHQLVNESDGDCVFLAIGRPSASDCHYSDVDLHLSGGSYRRKDGSAY
ncbi:cupin domain-containing protein [Sphingobium aromaticiconvertens]|uniref:cupin domain-containing protein n=1 Tax=Sphingobium aromaticiconvertens TaxID=365341 RepID=UPI00301AE283